MPSNLEGKFNDLNSLLNLYATLGIKDKPGASTLPFNKSMKISLGRN